MRITGELYCSSSFNLTFFVSCHSLLCISVGHTSGSEVSPRTVRWGGTLLPQAIGWAMEWLATTVTAASGGSRELLLEPRTARCKRMRSSCWVPQPVFRVRGESYRPADPSSLTAFLPYQTILLRLPQHPCCQTPPARRLPWRHPALRPAPSAGQHPQRTGLCGRPTPSRP